jgi:hypothetical protein
MRVEGTTLRPSNDEIERRGLGRRKTKLIYPNHRLLPWLSEDTPRDRSNRLLAGSPALAAQNRPT